jgi:hypothetical protein|tara:strand:+ start:519 stop:1085 length:567 start_codon:yes stop_codon:yes gene_type:complete
MQAQNEEKSLDSVKSDLMQDIRTCVQEYAKEMQLQKVKSLSSYDPEKVAKILYLFSTGNSQTRLVRHYGMSRNTVVNILVEYADHIKRFKELGGKLAARNYVHMSSLEEDLIDKVRDRMENDPEMQVSFKDLKELSIAKANANREALTARGEASSIVQEKKVFKDEDYEREIALARKRLQEESIDIKE